MEEMCIGATSTNLKDFLNSSPFFIKNAGATDKNQPYKASP
jgi:hypothetical protein